jgi:hypothetical protein
MSVQDTIIIRDLQQRVAMLGALTQTLIEESAMAAARLEALEAAQGAPSAGQAECATCTQRRAVNAQRQRRHRHVTEKPDGAGNPAVAELVSAFAGE